MSIKKEIDEIKRTLANLEGKLKRDQELESQLEIKNTLLTEKNKEIENQKKQIEILNTELIKADEDFVKLEKENQELSKNEITKTEIIAKMKEILEKALHNVIINVPNIADLQDLHLYDIRAHVNMKIACLINLDIELHQHLLEEFDSLENISLKTYPAEDRYVLLRDGEELLFVAIGMEKDNYLSFHTKDPAHIKLFNTLAMEAWLRGRKI